MKSRSYLQLAVLGWLLFAGVPAAQCGDSKPAAIPPAPITVDRRDAKSSIVLIGAQVVEIHGDVKAALKEAGFWYFTQIERTKGGESAFVFDGAGRSAERAADESKSNRDPLDVFRKRPETIVLCDAHIKTVIGQSSNLMISAAPRMKLPYLVRTGEKTFELKEFEAERLGVTLQFTPEPDRDEPGIIRMAPLKVSTTTLDARETTPGVDLEIGKPIVSTRTLETSIRLVDGQNSTGIILPGPEGRQLVLFVTAETVREFGRVGRQHARSKIDPSPGTLTAPGEIRPNP